MDIPLRFVDVDYVVARIPGCENGANLSLGANCQLYAYEFLREHGFIVPDLRSSEMWKDAQFSETILSSDLLESYDLCFYHHQKDAYGAHVGVYHGDGKVLHLSQANGKPRIECHDDLIQQEKYRHFLGAKRFSRTET